MCIVSLLVRKVSIVLLYDVVLIRDGVFEGHSISFLPCEILVDYPVYVNGNVISVQ